MQASSITHNIIQSSATNNQPIHILSDQSGSIFDIFIRDMDELLIWANKDFKSFDHRISYDIVLSHDPIKISSMIRSLDQLHLNNIIYFHSMCPQNFKKEDKFLLKQTILSSNKIFCSKEVMGSWGFEENVKCNIIEYGVSSKFELIKKTKPVLVLNINNNPSINTLFSYIKNVFTDAYIINDPYDTDIFNIIASSAVVVEAESRFNALYALANECYVLTAMNDIKEDGVFAIPSYNNIIKDIHNLLLSYDETQAKKNRKNILEKYPDTEFKHSFIKVIKQARQEPYIYATNN